MVEAGIRLRFVQIIFFPFNIRRQKIRIIRLSAGEISKMRVKNLAIYWLVPLMAAIIHLLSSYLSAQDKPVGNGLPARESDGRMIFRSTRGGKSDIYSVNADGSNQKRLTI